MGSMARPSQRERIALRRVSTVDAVAERLRELILDGTFPAGSALTESELTETFGVSRHTVRTALQLLVPDGLVELVANRGAFVPVMDADDVVDLFQLRSTIELTATEALTRGDPSGLTGLRAAAQALADLPGEIEYAEVRDADLAFHQAIVDSAGGSRTSRAYASLLMELKLCFLQIQPEFEDPRDVERQHQAILDSIAGGDPEAAVALLRRHLDESCEHIVAAQAAAAAAPPR